MSSDTTSRICVVTVGQPGNGKSTALNNIFGLQLKSSFSAYGVTKSVFSSSISKYGIELNVIDTPGLGDLNISNEKTINDLVKVLKDQDYTLIYCLQVGPSNRFTEKDVNTIKALQQALGTNIWNKCVILLTFSDEVRNEFEGDQPKEEYKAYLKEYSQAFQEALISCGTNDYTVRTIFECEVTKLEYKENHAYSRLEKEKEIIAIPVGENTIVEEDILPDIIPKEKDWTHLVYLELMRKTEEEKLRSFMLFKFGELFDQALKGTIFSGIGAAVHEASCTLHQIITFMHMIDEKNLDKQKI